MVPPALDSHIWSSSYVTYACGWSLLLLALFYWVIDVQGFRKWAFFFVVIGMNAITIYFLQSIVDFDEIGKLFVQGIREHSGVLQPIVLPLGGTGLEVALALAPLPSQDLLPAVNRRRKGRSADSATKSGDDTSDRWEGERKEEAGAGSRSGRACAGRAMEP